MPLISICEHGFTTPGPVIVIDGVEHPFTLQDPFSEQDEQRLEWYFEEHLRFPFTDQVKAREAAASIRDYGHRLFDELFADRRAYRHYQAALQQGIKYLSFEIVGSPAFHRLHWEALKDPDLPQPFALQTPFVRRNLTPRTVEATVRPSPTINLLIVAARPGGANDVGYRTISRPLVTALRQADLRVKVDILRPGTYAALTHHLEAKQDEHGAGYYHVIHFDVHGSLLTYDQFDRLEIAQPFSPHTFQPDRFGRPVIPLYAGQKAFLFFESSESGKADPVEANELADLLLSHQIPIAILNAGQSGKQMSASKTSLASQLMQAGVQMVLAMSYSVTVSAAALLMQQLYAQLFTGSDLTAAICSARLGLYNRKIRRAYYNQTIDLEDWLLPVVYQNQPQQLTTRAFTADEHLNFYVRQANRYPDAKVTYEFVGRDLDILHIERQLLTQRNILLVRGMGGAGKTTLLHHLAHWWQTTGFVDQVFYFGYDQRAYNRQQLMDAIARQLLGEINYVPQFQRLSGDEAKQAFLTEQLRATRHLLILDNLESITGSALAIPNTLPATEQAALHRLLSVLAGGKTFVLLGSRGAEAWLAPQTFGANVYDLPGLDEEAASALADLILARHHATHYRADPDLQRLLKLLDGYPLALEVVLANLAHQTPAQVLAALQAGDESLDPQGQANAESGVDEPFRIPGAASQKRRPLGPELRTQSILQCIAYSHSNLSLEAQQLLLCLAPFTGVLNQTWLPQYTAHLQAQPALAHLPFAQWATVLQQAANWGLLALHSEIASYLRLQPILPYFLKQRLEHAPAALVLAIETAFRCHYAEVGAALAAAIKAKEPNQRTTGLRLTQLEYENLATSLNLALATKQPFYAAFEALYEYLLASQDTQRRLALCTAVSAEQPTYPAAQLAGEIGSEFYLVLARLGRTYLEARQYAQAQHTSEQALVTVTNLHALTKETRARWQATMYHQLGIVASEQRQWAQAEQHYQHALTLYNEYNDRYSQAHTYHQLGRVAQAQRQWAQAEQHYQQALQIKIEYNDRYSQAGTYHQLGMVAEEQRQWAQAEQHYQHALALTIEYNDRYSQAHTYHQLGRVASEQGQRVQAEQHYQHALALYIEYNDRYSQARTYHNLGNTAQEQGQWVQAEQHYQHALELYVEYNDRYSQASTYHQLGRVAQAQQHWVQAEVYYQLALQLQIEYNDRYSQAVTYGQLGLLAEAQGRPAQAAAALRQALTLFHEFNDEHSTQMTLRTLAHLWQATGFTDLPATVATLLNATPAEVETFFGQTLLQAEPQQRDRSVPPSDPTLLAAGGEHL